MIQAFIEGWNIGAPLLAGGIGVVLPWVIAIGVLYLIVELVSRKLK